MGNLLLNSKSSTPFSLGHNEEYITDKLEDRIIRFKTSLSRINFYDLVEYFNQYDNLHIEGKSTNIMGDFLLDQFFDKIRTEGHFDEVFYYSRNIGEIENSYGYAYTFINNGYTIRVQDKNSKKNITEISRLVKIIKNENEHVIICDQKAGKYVHFGRPSLKFSAAQALIKKNCTLSLMLVYPIDGFSKSLHGKGSGNYRFVKNLSRTNQIEEFLNYNENNLIMVHSISSTDLEFLGKKVLDEIKKNKLILTR